MFVATLDMWYGKINGDGQIKVPSPQFVDRILNVIRWSDHGNLIMLIASDWGRSIFDQAQILVRT